MILTAIIEMAMRPKAITRKTRKRRTSSATQPSKRTLDPTKENTFLKRELSKIHQQQTATANILKIISRSNFDLSALLNTLVKSAARLCEADMVSILQPRGKIFQYAASCGYSPEFVRFMEEHPLGMGRGTVVGRTLLEGKPVHVPDVTVDPGYTFLDAQKVGRFRTILGVPMLRQASPIGVIVLMRTRDIELVATFADKAVIAIENVRLVKKLQAQSADLANWNRSPSKRSQSKLLKSSESGGLSAFSHLRSQSSSCRRAGSTCWRVIGARSPSYSAIFADTRHLLRLPNPRR
jgi:transcriptional regulator with GAF, ATPase, and Fis domain